MCLTMNAVHAEGATNAAPVVIVCEHGSAKSLIAALLFDAGAKARGLPFRAVSRGTDPDASVPAKIADALAGEGFDVRDFRPVKLSAEDMQQAPGVISIGAAVPEVAHMRGGAVMRWDEIPSAGQDFKASKAALQRRVDALLDRLSLTLDR